MDHGPVCEAVILAAGGGRRMGGPKALLQVDGEPLLVQHVRAYESVGLRVTVVIGAEGERVRELLPRGARVVVNRDWARSDPAASAWLALEGLGDCLLSPVDLPPPSRETLVALLAANGDTVPSYQGRDGHPVRLAAPHRPGRLDERLREAARVAVSDPNCVLNFNVPADLAAWRSVSRPA